MPGENELTVEDLTRIAERFRVLGEANRLKILMSLSGGEQTVNGLVSMTGVAQANLSRHLNGLYQAGIVRRRKVGTWVYYAIKDRTVFDLCECVCRGFGRVPREKARLFGLREAGSEPGKSPLNR